MQKLHTRSASLQGLASFTAFRVSGLGYGSSWDLRIVHGAGYSVGWDSHVEKDW